MSRSIVFACGRANLGRAALPPSVQLIELPCTGRVSIPLILAGMARGAQGVLVLGRHQETCRLRGAEDPCRDRTSRASRLLALTGLGAERAQFVVPAAGAHGPLRAIEAFLDSLRTLGESPIQGTPPGSMLAGEGLPTALALLDWMSRQPGLAPDATAWLEEQELPSPAPGRPVLFAGALPRVDLLAGDLLRPVRPVSALRTALAMMARLGLDGAGVWIGPPSGEVLARASARLTLDPDDQAQLESAGLSASTLDRLLLEKGAELTRATQPGTVACLSAESVSLAEKLGYRAHRLDAAAAKAVTGPGLPAVLGPLDRALLDGQLCEAERNGAVSVLASAPMDLVRWAVLTRQGAWRTSRPLPALGCQLAWLAASGIPLTLRAPEVAP